jgi:hypothetical protein
MMSKRYDEIKNLVNKARLLVEQEEINLSKDIETDIQLDDTEESSEDKEVTYRISGGLLTIHGKDKKDLEISTDEKLAFQETMDEFVEEVSDLSDFGTLNIYTNNVDWSGKVIDYDVEFYFSIGENNGVYINGDLIKLDENTLELFDNLRQYYEKFKSKWARIVSQRKKTQSES